MTRLVAAVCCLVLAVVAAGTVVRADAAVFDGALGVGGGDDGGAVRVLLELHAQQQRDAQFSQHVASLVSALQAQAQADSRAYVIDETDAAAAEAEADEAEALFASAAVAEEDIASDLQAEGLEGAPVFGEAAEQPADVWEANAAPESAEDMDEFSAGPALVEVDAGESDESGAAEAEAEAEADSAEGQVFGEAPEAVAEIFEAEAAPESAADMIEWSAGPALVELTEAEADEDEDADADADAEESADESDAEDEDVSEADDAADAEAEADDAEPTAFVQVQVQGDWKDPPVWWKAPEEEMANADQQPWPLDPNFPMSVLDPPPNLPLANIEDPNNYPPMADPNLAFNIDPSAFPQTNPKVGADDPSFASFSINGR